MTDYTELKRLVDRVLTDRRFCGDENHKALADGVRALIAENERIQEAHEQICTNYNQVSYASEERGKQIDQLKAENDALKGPHDWLAEDLIKELVDNAQAIQENADDGEEDSFVIVLLASASRIRRQEANIEQLRAEVAGLRTGYEAYERVNAELKAEVARSTEREVLQLAEIEALRKALKPLLAHWDDLKPGESLNVDAARAAMGQGEQS